MRFLFPVIILSITIVSCSDSTDLSLEQSNAYLDTARNWAKNELFEPNERMEYYEKAINANEDNCNAYYDYVYALSEIEQYEVALTKFDLIPLKCQDPVYHYNLQGDLLSYLVRNPDYTSYDVTEIGAAKPHLEAGNVNGNCGV